MTNHIETNSEGTRAIVTGHSKGLGFGVCHAFLQRGVPVLGVARSQWVVPVPVGLLQVMLDLADAQALAGWLDSGQLQRFVEGADRVVLINNAGVVGPVAPCQRQETKAIARSVSLNVSAPLVLTSALAQLGTVPETRVVHVSSGAARNAYPGWSVYCATKAALDHHARSIALDQSPGLRVVSLAPGVIDTGMQTAIRATSEADFPNVARFTDLKAQGRLADPLQAGEQVVAYALGPSFGAHVVADLRD